MKINVLLLSFLFFFVCQFQEAQSQDEQGTHTFKIVGSKKISIPNGTKTVEYDPDSNNHLYISSFGENGNISSKRQLLFTGKKFNLSVNYLVYKNKGEIQQDGSAIYYDEYGTIVKTIVYKEEKIVSQIFFYSNGQKQSSVPGIDILNGEYKLWHPNGQLSFSGYYKDNLKNGDFEQFDESGASIKKGIYNEGKLISGEPVVADLIYPNPDVPAKFALGEEGFNEYLTKKAAGPNATKIIFNNKKFVLYITFDKTGKMTDIKNSTMANNEETESIKLILKNCPAFSPALAEGLPVRSRQRFVIQISRERVKLNSESEEKIYTEVEEMPKFPGGDKALLNFLASKVIYPRDASFSKIQGKVVVAFIIDIEGNVTEPRILRSVHPSLDAEALRVVTNMPKWTPGKQDGKPVSVGLTIPVSFMLQ